LHITTQANLYIYPSNPGRKKMFIATQAAAGLSYQFQAADEW